MYIRVCVKQCFVCVIFNVFPYFICIIVLMHAVISFKEGKFNASCNILVSSRYQRFVAIKKIVFNRPYETSNEVRDVNQTRSETLSTQIRPFMLTRLTKQEHKQKLFRAFYVRPFIIHRTSEQTIRCLWFPLHWFCVFRFVHCQTSFRCVNKTWLSQNKNITCLWNRYTLQLHN